MIDVVKSDRSGKYFIRSNGHHIALVEDESTTITFATLLNKQNPIN